MGGEEEDQEVSIFSISFLPSSEVRKEGALTQTNRGKTEIQTQRRERGAHHAHKLLPPNLILPSSPIKETPPRNCTSKFKFEILPVFI